jgi:hypothetical protein
MQQKHVTYPPSIIAAATIITQQWTGLHDVIALLSQFYLHSHNKNVQSVAFEMRNQIDRLVVAQT